MKDARVWGALAHKNGALRAFVNKNDGQEEPKGTISSTSTFGIKAVGIIMLHESNAITVYPIALRWSDRAISRECNRLRTFGLN